jgi:hypothetical protein
VTRVHKEVQSGESVRSTATISWGLRGGSSSTRAVAWGEALELTWRVNVRERWRCELFKGAYLNGLPHTCLYPTPYLTPRASKTPGSMIPGNQFLKLIKNVLRLSSTIYEGATKEKAPTFWSCIKGTPPTWESGF